MSDTSKSEWYEGIIPHDMRVNPVDCPARLPGDATCDTHAHAMLDRWVKEYREEKDDD